MKIIRHRERKEFTRYTRAFDYENENGWGFSFDCDEHGNVDVDKLHPNARKSYAECLAGSMQIRKSAQYAIGSDAEGETVYMLIPGSGYLTKVKLIDRGVRTEHASYTEPAIGECACGEHVELYGFTNTCPRCERDYNSAGQLLAHRSQWGEETGESVSDILSVDSTPTDRLFEE